MKRKPSSSVSKVLLLLLLVVGPLQAQSVFACEMMDEVMVGDCCCVGHKSDDDCADAVCDGALHSNDDPCCERSVEVSLDNEARQDAPIFKPTDVRSNVDPPTAILASFNVLEPPRSRVADRVVYPFPNISRAGSDTYLITQRLRI